MQHQPDPKDVPRMLHRLQQIANQFNRVEESSVFSFCETLFAPKAGSKSSARAAKSRLSIVGSADTESIETRVGNWLREELKPLASSGADRCGEDETVWRQMCVGNADAAIETATRLAQRASSATEARDMNRIADTLSLLDRAALLSIVSKWECSVASFQSEWLVRLCGLLAGRPTLDVRLPDESSPRRLRCWAGMHWMQALGVRLWFLKQPLADAMRALEVDVQSGVLDGGSDILARSLHWHLLSLYVNRSYPLEAIIDAADETLGSQATWYVWWTLRAVGFNHLHPANTTLLHRRQALRLVECGDLEAATLALAHIEDQITRETAVAELLDRFGQDLTDEQLASIQHNLRNGSAGPVTEEP